ncbi:hypothetical protein M885DRAFT_621736 [Pelagophyceae sp. CCMP2097]|nr:hypothetical protein M885DRAFT_621736 [Pelagophyceae sp. CCMP2097]
MLFSKASARPRPFAPPPPRAPPAEAPGPRRRGAISSLKEVLAAQVPQKQAELKELKAKHGNRVIGEVTVDQCIGGARSVKCMLWETSLLDADEGIRFRGHSIPELQKILPTSDAAPHPFANDLRGRVWQRDQFTPRAKSASRPLDSQSRRGPFSTRIRDVERPRNFPATAGFSTVPERRDSGSVVASERRLQHGKSGQSYPGSTH